MASTSDGGRTVEIEFSSMKQPPLIKQLKGILSEYPDGGQILKEIIQNADDAEAVEVQIVYDGRRINNTTGEATPAYNRFFKGPSLCIYNDTVFAEKDWDGIRMIYSTVKEDDTLTVGRSGLGFKSVFHITDYPCVISGDKMLLIDPQQPSDKVNAMINLDDIEQLKDKGLNARAFWEALDSNFGFNRACVQRGYFKGTIFRFPLRERKSEISENVYDEAKLLDLFDGFQTEASSILLFLKNLQRISVSTIGADNQMKEMMKTEIDDSSGKLKERKAKFKEKFKLLAIGYKWEDITVDLQMTIRTTINGICECAQWQVVNYFVGNSASSDFKRLILDEDLGYSPYVGVASPLNEAKTRFEGHVFCFLPILRKGSRLTGLPVHVNGCFALSQNRHDLKWETDEQKGNEIDDKNIQWNKYLIKEALPRAYSRLVQCVVDVSNNLGNTDDSVAVVYNCLPLASSTENKWRVLETELYKKIKKLRFFYSKHQNKWVTMADVTFASFDELPEDYKHVQNAVIRCLSLIGELPVEMPSEVLQNLQKHYTAIKDLTPEFLAKLLRQNAAYTNLSNSDKLDVLTYLCSEGRYHQMVEGLELLPLARGGWTSYRSQPEPVYMCTDEEAEILKGIDNIMTVQPSSLGTTMMHHMHQICSKDLFQIKKLTDSDLAILLDSTIQEEFEASFWIPEEPLTTKIHALLCVGYTDCLSVPRELIQNADDAGASVVKFLYDERQNNDSKQTVFSERMRSFQGPALWSFNDARFSTDDMNNVAKMHASTKKPDVRKIGHFGLGFCSVYNLTDLPSFLSGSSLVYFDPHGKYLGNFSSGTRTGVKFRLPNKTLVSTYIDQIMPYSGIFGCNIEQDDFKEYNGTLFRLPLRTEKQAGESCISSVSYTKEEMVTLLRMFVKTAGNFLLFTQNVKKIEIYHLCESATTTSEQKLLYIVEKNSVKWDQNVTGSIDKSVLARIPEVLEKTCNFREIHKSAILQTLTENARRTIPDLDVSANYLETTWITSWAKGDGKSLQMYKYVSSEVAAPLSAVAIPCTESNVLTLMELKNLPFGFYQEGHIFYFLPLPLKTKLPVHINGCFSVTSDHQQLASLTEDDKNSNGNIWNVALMEDSLAEAFLYLIQALASSKIKVNSGYKYFDLWPVKCAPIALPFRESFYRAIIEKNIKVFKGYQTWVSFQNAVFLDPDIYESGFGELAFEILSHFPPRRGKTLIEMPKQIIENIRQSNRGLEHFISSAQICEKEFFLAFLETLYSDFWISRLEERNKLIIAALECRTDEVEKEMRNIKCIPSESKNVLARASDLIHPDLPLASLFSNSEEVFPLNTREFRTDSILAKLVGLGMNAAILPCSLLIDKWESVSTLASKCGICAHETFVNLMRYFSHDLVLRELEKDKFTVGTITDHLMFPVLSKPTGWKFSWKAESDIRQLKICSGSHTCNRHRRVKDQFLFGKSKNLYRQSTADYIGIVGYMVDESYIFNLKVKRNSSERVLKLLGIKDVDEVPVNILSAQIQQLSKEYTDKKEQFEDVTRIHGKIFKHLEKKMKLSEIPESEKQSIDILRNCRFVLIGDELLNAQNVSFNVKEEYRPHLYRLPEIDKLSKSTVYTYLGVRQHFSVEIIIEVIKAIRQTGGKIQDVETMNKLLINLDEIMQNDGITYEELKEFHDEIVAPDINCMLWPTHQLVFENIEDNTSMSMNILHPSVSPTVAKRLGVMVNQLQDFEDLSNEIILFGQHETLAMRINHLLKAWPCNSNIMKQLLQNADNAGATVIHFVKDYRNHSTKRLFQTSCEVLQGPSLCVYYNSYFTKKDIEGICNLDQGSKSDDPTKIGKYGFNVVYHLTDIPSIVTIGPDDANGGLMFIFDPLCKYVPQATVQSPGIMCKISDVETNFPDHMLGFSISELIKGDVGTVFRFPLRKTSSDISEEEITTSRVDDILHSFENDMSKSVPFLENISCIKVLNITSGKLVEEYSVKVKLSMATRKEKKTSECDRSDVHPNPGPESVSSDNMSTSMYSDLLNSGLSIMHLNIQSLKPKLDILAAESLPYDIMFLTETWLSHDVINEDVLIPGFSQPVRCDRDDRLGGGVAIYVRQNINVTHRQDLSVNGLEAVWIELHVNNRKLLLGGIYRPPSANNNYWQLLEHTKEWFKLAKQVTKKDSSKSAPNLVSGNAQASSDVDKANLLNQYFCSQSSIDDTGHELPNIPVSRCSFQDISISVQDVIDNYGLWILTPKKLKLFYSLGREISGKNVFSFVRPLLEYGDVIWDNCSVELKNDIDAVQTEAARIVTGATKLCNIQTMLSELRWDTLPIRPDEHAALTVTQFTFGKDDVGQCIRYIVVDLKPFKEAFFHKKVLAKDIKQYADDSNPRCVVRFLRKYLIISFVPKDGPFYRRPLATKTADGGPKYSAQKVGVHTIQKFMSRMCERAGIRGFKTGHSASKSDGKARKDEERRGKARKGISFSSMKQPPLIKQLKGILSEYPDGGQILKELIQNAEDAEAREVKIVYDRRKINEQTSGNNLKYTKFFRGPALCIYNDAVFSDTDWEGIRMIYSSVKEEDPLKVGRFGLGFKSVFHMTDYPCILSGTKVLLIDPTQPSDMVNAMIELNEVEHLAKCGLGAAEFWKAFKGTFDFTKEVVKRGHYKGTIMRFPLRDKQSVLSDTLYDEEKVMALFECFQAESSSILIFLKSLEHVSLSIRDIKNSLTEIMTVKIKNQSSQSKEHMIRFREAIKTASLATYKKDVKCELNMTVDVIVEGKHTCTEWLVINYFVAENVSPEFNRLIGDRNLGYSPTVGVAQPLYHDSVTFEGHVFCFLPLPREGTRLTGLPVHVNGYFALSQNRHHLKWETDEQHGRKIDDKAILWNKCLISEALPRAYEALILAVIKRSDINRNTPASVATVYKCMPDCMKTERRWSVLENTLYQRLSRRKCVYHGDTDNWISFNDACFATFIDTTVAPNVQKSVIKCLNAIGSKYVDIPVPVFQTLKRQFAFIQDLSPASLVQSLRQSSGYKSMSSRHKAGILTYLFSNETNYKEVNGLDLLPLHSERWSTYDSKADKVFICPLDQIKILPYHDEKLVLQDPVLGESLTRHLTHIAKQGLYQLRMMDTETLKRFLQETVTKYKSKTPPKLLSWLKAVWRYITTEHSLKRFKDVSILPLLTKGTWKEPKAVELLKLSDLLLVQLNGKDELSDEICRCFQAMGVTIIKSFPKWIPKDVVKAHVFWPTTKSVVSLLSAISSDDTPENVISKFNETCEWKDKQILLSYVTEVSSVLTHEAVQLIKELHIFKAIRFRKDIGHEASVSQTKLHIYETEDFPDQILYPFAYLSADKSKENLLTKLGSQRVALSSLVMETVKRFKIEHKSSDIPTFMTYFMENFHRFEAEKEIVECASEISFVKAGSKLHKPFDLFDPSDPCLQNLLQGEHLLPDSIDGADSKIIYCLRRLGLKGVQDIDANIALQIAQSLDKICHGKKMKINITSKAFELMNLFKCRPKLLENKCSTGSTLGDSLKDLHFMIVQASRKQHYPECVEWCSYSNLLCKPSEAKDVSLCFLVGAIMPTVACPADELSKFFGLKTLPRVTDVIRQLEVVKASFSVDSCSDIKPMLKQIYTFLDTRKEELKTNMQFLENKAVIWTRGGFVTAEKVTVKRSYEDINLQPYSYALPEEFEKKESLFVLFGCRYLQDVQVLLDTLHMIDITHRQVQRIEDVKRDKTTTRNILERLATLAEQEDFRLEDLETGVLMMVKDSKLRLKLVPVEECVYDDDPGYFYEEDDNVHFVHEMVSQKTAQLLGVESLSRKVLLNAEEIGVEDWGQNERLTTRIKSLLDEGYTDGVSVPKELIQNADDAGATTVKFLYDERHNMKARKRVFSKEMKNFQGPALWIYNNALFTEEDLQNITKMNEATKQKDVRKIGKFGLGFNSVYNLTDVPSLISGKNIVFFDPHEKYFTQILGRKSKGLKYQLSNKTLVSRYMDQFKPYNGIFGCELADDIFSNFSGTLFRLPLRTEQQASESEISTKAYTKREMQTLLEMFMNAAGNFLLFLQNVKSIEICHLPANARNASEHKLLYKLRKDSLKLENGVHVPITESVLSRIQDIVKNNTGLVEIHQSVFYQEVSGYAKQMMRGVCKMSKSSKTTWITAWATGNENSLKQHEDSLLQTSVPLSAVAVPLDKDDDDVHSLELKHAPLGFYREGHVFCFLPLPLKTKLPVHINGCFAVTSSRRQLASLTEDDKYSKDNAWNISLMEDALVIAQVNLLEAIVEINLTQNANYKYYDLWPQQCEPIVRPFMESFYRHIIVSNAAVFKGSKSWIRFRDVTFLDPRISQSTIGQIAFTFLDQYPARDGKTLIDMPKRILDLLISSNQANKSIIEEAVINECELFSHFLSKIHFPFWDIRLLERNTMIIAALKTKNDTVRRLVQDTECIPTTPNNRLSKASDLVHPTSSLARLFEKNEERFPLDEKDFVDASILQILVSLGMNEDSLPADLVLNRCDSIHGLALKCCCCALDRSIHVLKYMCKDHVIDILNEDKHLSERIKNSFMLPVLQKPECWPFSWRASGKSTRLKRFNGNNASCSQKAHRETRISLVLGNPKDLLRERVKYYIGSVSLVLDETVLNTDMNRFAKLCLIMGIKDRDELPLKMVVDQLQKMSKEFKNKTSHLKEVTKIHGMIFRYLNNVIELNASESHLHDLDSLRSFAVILIGSTFVQASNIAFDVKEECRPHLYRLPEQEQLMRKPLYKYLGVKERFSMETIIDVMDTLCHKGKKASNIEAVKHLLINLLDIMEMEGTEYNAIAQWHDRIVAPDVHCVCWPTNELICENKDFETSTSMKIMHPSIAPQIGMALGVKAKQLRCFEEISIGISFGQQERLVTRIKGLLKAYPRDASIMKELLQNADDAGATEIHFIKDYRNHSTKRIFQKSSEPLQGPSLCVFNNSYFRKEDIDGIHNLGQGSKSDDPTKTGQYGVGFNAVYHLTDTPSFITKAPQIENGGHLIILDPLCSHVPKATVLEPGIMCALDDVHRSFSDHLLGFSINELIQGDLGTVFRFPLRSQPSDISKETVDTKKMDDLLNTFESDMLELVLFLKNITCIKILNITSGFLREEYSINVQLPSKGKKERASFIAHVKSKKNKSNKEKHLDINPVESIYHMKVADSKGTCTNWIIVQRFGIDKSACSENMEIIKDRFKCGDLGLLPVGGVAFPMNKYLLTKKFKTKEFLSHSADVGILGLAATPSSQRVLHEVKTFKGKAFCFLPLPIETGLPVHVNGHFALDHEARRELWKEGYRHIWNCCVSEAIIVPAWISGLRYICELIQSAIEKSTSPEMVNAVLSNYHYYFPMQDCNLVLTWENVAKKFYNHLVDKRVELFPYVFDRKNEIAPPDGIFNSYSGRFHALFTFVENETEQFRHGIFNSIEGHISTSYLPDVWLKREADCLKQLLMSFGMKLLSTPDSIREAMTAAGIENIPASSPFLVISFLKSYNYKCGRHCNVGTINKVIGETKYKTSVNLYTVIKYIISDQSFFEKLEGLPILLTADGILKRCSKEEPAFLTEYSPLLPRSEHDFVHEDIRMAFVDERLFLSGCFKRFLFDDFLRLLPHSFDIDAVARTNRITVQDSGYDQGAISSEWLCMFYDFLCTRSCHGVSGDNSTLQHETGTDVLPCVMSRPDLDTKKVKEHLQALKDWCFLPCLQSDTQRCLIPLREVSSLLYLDDTQRQDTLGKALETLGLPTLDMQAFSKCKMKEDVEFTMVKFVASPARPFELLQCLAYHRNSITSLKNETGNSILAFLGRNLTALTCQSDQIALKQALRNLPLFLTQDGRLTDISVNCEIFVLPKGMPADGIQIWAHECETTLLRKHDALESLHHFLGLQNTEIGHVYATKILPKFNALPKQNWLCHIKYIRNRLKHFTGEIQEKIILELKQVAFININDAMRRADELYDPSSQVLKHMKGRKDFPPKKFMKKEWYIFLKKLGMVTDVNDDMLIEFAHQIETDATNHQTEAVRKRSRILFDRFVQNNGTEWNTQTLHQIRMVRFIEPVTLSGEEELQICQQFDKAGRFICFQDAVPCIHWKLCWTSLNLLPQNVSQLHDNVRQELKVHEIPPIESVILHCQNVVDSLKEKINLKSVSVEFVKQQMTIFYDFISDKRSSVSDSMVKKRLEHKPFVHLPNDSKMVRACDVIIDLDPSLEIKPYLYRAPKYYGKYHDLFEFLGSKTKILFYHYAAILDTLKTKCKDDQMHPTEKSIAQRAVSGLVNIDAESDESLQTVKSVYLPNVDLLLVDSKNIVISNNQWYEQRLQGNIKLDIFAGNPFLDLKENCNFEEMFSKWPANLKPKFLTDIVSEKLYIGLEDEENVESSDKANMISLFLHSSELAIALCRLLKCQFSTGTKKLKYDATYFEAEIQKRLQGTRVVEMQSLRTVLIYSGESVSGSETDIPYYIKSGIDDCIFYFKDISRDETDNVSFILPGLIELIQECAVGLGTRYIGHLTSLLSTIKDPKKIPSMLDHLNVQSYDHIFSPRKEYFPRPGTYLEKKFYPFLEQSIFPFNDYEFNNVAMELDDIETNDQLNEGPVYIYVRIVKELNVAGISCDLRRIYIVNTGNHDLSSERVPIYRLYRFVRKENESGNELQTYDIEPTHSRTFDANCLRIKRDLEEAWALPEIDRKRILRRLLLKWHPDKNRGDEEYCRKMFLFIKIVTSRLENEESITENVNQEMRKGRSNVSSSSSTFYETINRRAKVYARSFYDDYEDYNRSERTGRYSHSTATKAKHPDHVEAKRWLRQAQNDVRAAEAMLTAVDSVDGHNWICYTSHQACEKALKSARYSQDANDVPKGGRSHNLTSLTSDPEMKEQARMIEERLGSHARLRYPDALSRPKIPSDIFNKEDAEFSIKIARRIVAMVEDFIS
ncbi:sacsin-like [Mercenaria mercenaria]|uniref:sacsin-like n=1 Tax=Mercenaria mercenaria TaxID=6596 RepID=UPI00234E466D|nr:sacsin-like [Mercenaria mercenaria]